VFSKEMGRYGKGIKAPKDSDGIGRFGKDWVGKVDLLAW
jgi:hypothetical protein